MCFDHRLARECRQAQYNAFLSQGIFYLGFPTPILVFEAFAQLIARRNGNDIVMDGKLADSCS